MQYSAVIPDNRGNHYIINIDYCNIDNIDVSVPIMNVAIVTDSHLEGFNSFDILNKFANCIANYIQNNRVILYYYCDTAEVERNIKNQKYTPQEYRNRIFTALIQRKITKDYIHKDVNLFYNEGYFINLIGHKSLKTDIEIASNEVKAMSDK